MNIEEIKQRIKDDKNKSASSYRRYPVRFLFTTLPDVQMQQIFTVCTMNFKDKRL